MPRGEHFKKENPRNIQVSFKVNESELVLLKAIAAEEGMSIPQWLRKHIKPSDQLNRIVKPGVTAEEVNNSKTSETKSPPKKKTKKTAKKPQSPDQQISLF